MNDDINLKRIFHMIVDGKWLIFAFMLVGLTLSTIYVLNIKEVFVSQINFEKTYNNDESISIQEYFYNEKNFNQWQESSGDKSISFFDVSQTYSTNDNEVFLKPIEDHYVYFEENKLIVKINDINKINAFQSYLVYLSDLTKKDLLLNINSKLEKINQAQRNEELIKRSIIADPDYSTTNGLKFEKELIEKMSGYRISPPTFPAKQKTKSLTIIGLATLANAMLGIFILLLRESLKD